MRILAALALGAVTAVTLFSAPASAAQCPIERASYQSKEAPNFTMLFREVSRSRSDTRLQATIYNGATMGIFGNRVVELTFTYSMGYSVDYAIGTSTAIETSPGEMLLQSRVIALEADFRAASISGGPGSAAPYAIMIPDIGQQLYNATKHDPKRQTSIPEGAWVLTVCR